MSIPIQRNPRDPGPHLPKSGGTPFMGSHRDMCDPLSLDAKWIRHLRRKSKGCSEVLDAAGTQRSDDMGHVHVRDSAISPRLESSASSIRHHVNSSQSGPESTLASSSPILTPPKPSTFRRAHALWAEDCVRSSTTRPKSVQWNDEDNNSKTMRQPETRPISQDQLVAEVKGIYAGLVMVETKCIEVDNVQPSVANADNHSKLSNEQWQALIALHRTLLHEHHDFFLASQHPSASPALRRLAPKYAVPARMWRHGIHSFLELLRHRLPSSLEHMLAFIYLAYSMMALLYETVPSFEDTWIECLGDLGRYRMAIEDDDIRDREAWTRVSRHWYSKAPVAAPNTGRLYHHLAILARPNAVQQLYYYTKALAMPIPFSSARQSIMPLFDPVLSNSPTRLAPIDSAFVRAHGILFSSDKSESFNSSILSPIEALDENGIDIHSLGTCYSPTLDGWEQAPRPLSEDFAMRGILYCKDYFPILSCKSESISSSILCLSKSVDEWPGKYWKCLSQILNSLLPDEGLEQAPKPLPEDFVMRGLLYCENYFPTDWFGFDAGYHLDFDPLILQPDSLPPSHRIDSTSEKFWLSCNYGYYFTAKVLHSVADYLARLASIQSVVAHRYFDGFLHPAKVAFCDQKTSMMKHFSHSSLMFAHEQHQYA
ncbi:hypothetical protein EDB82DRAFT_503016 [Fusarium venenatum]|uniref:uncharacterized protein n=1 Tax=Fusarium venenatum TaxID=56646 RepID=UPI001D87C4F1|nr:hypothetical protein EDB82DRAFT_503016 [Fusarium venenatum]